MAEITVEQTKIPGLLTFNLVVNEDPRGTFTELFQAEKLTKLGLPEFHVVQTNLSTNNQRGVTRGIHAEPWNKYITCVKGEVFVAIVDLRRANFGQTATFKLSFGQAMFIPQGCANSYQVLSDEAHYLYNVDAHWQAGISYPSIYCFDPELKIDWPIPKSNAILSEKDQANSRLSEVQPV